MILLQTKQNADLKKSEVKITQESSKSKISHAIELLSLYMYQQIKFDKITGILNGYNLKQSKALI